MISCCCCGFIETLGCPGFEAFGMFNSWLRRFLSSNVRMKTTQVLDTLQGMIIKMQETTSLVEKRKILEAHSSVHQFLSFLFRSGPFHMTSRSLDKDIGDTQLDHKHEQLEDLLEDLAERRLTGHAAIQAFRQFMHRHPEHDCLLRCILDRDLRIRLGPASILKIAEGNKADRARLQVALAADLVDEPVRQYFEGTLLEGKVWMASRKLDGIRCLAILDGVKGTVDLQSRRGKSLNKLNIRKDFEGLLPKIGKQRLVLDGELCKIDGSGRESFGATSSAVLRAVRDEKGDGGHDLVCFAFDFLEYKQAIGMAASLPLKERLRLLAEMIVPGQRIRVLEQMPVASIFELEGQKSQALSKGWEGLILRRSESLHEGAKRTRDMVKWKRFQDTELQIIGYTASRQRIIHEGREVEEDLLASLEVDYNGQAVSVGSGFTLQERRALLKEGPGLIGQLATICYFQETQSQKNGSKPSLRFPIFKAIYRKL